MFPPIRLLFPLTAVIHFVTSTHISICLEDKTYEYSIDSCPGGIQIRDEGKWFSKPRNTTCVCGEGAMLQFDGEDSYQYPYVRAPEDSPPIFHGSWVDYYLSSECEVLQGDKPSALFIDARKYQESRYFPSAPIELVVQADNHDRLAGGYNIRLKKGKTDNIPDHQQFTTIMFNTQQPVLVNLDPSNNGKSMCANHPEDPQVIVSTYERAKVNLNLGTCPPYYTPYTRKSLPCPRTSCQANEKVIKEGEGENFQLKSFSQILETMVETSVRMKFAQRHLEFSGTNRPYMAMLQRSCRVFYRAHPTVLKWETFMNALTVFAVTFQGLIPNDFRLKHFDEIRMALARCAVTLERKREGNRMILFNHTCPGIETEMNNQTSSEKHAYSRKLTGAAGNETNTTEEPLNMEPSFNKLVELLWNMVQYTQAACFPSHDHHPNVHHTYGAAMLELFSTPAVQVLWHQKPEYAPALEKAMFHIFPELPDNALPTIDKILKESEFPTHFNILQRPKIKHLDKRDIRCGGHGKLIWEGKACCYLEEQYRKFYYYNRVAYAQM